MKLEQLPPPGLIPGRFRLSSKEEEFFLKLSTSVKKLGRVQLSPQETKGLRVLGILIDAVEGLKSQYSGQKRPQWQMLDDQKKIAECYKRNFSLEGKTALEWFEVNSEIIFNMPIMTRTTKADKQQAEALRAEKISMLKDILERVTRSARNQPALSYM